ncbi:MAG: sigma-70 family RNA polymerase sigma factor [Thermodesulfovibrionales bacterium]|nr:sigma-70 family RNA polymerase sigma factor [Thermodesulfovibrionales bacterium]
MRTEVPNTIREDDIFAEIIDSGKMCGMLTYSEIHDAFLPGSLCNDELEDLLDLLHDTGVKVVDSQEITNSEEEELGEQEKQDEDENENEKTKDLIHAYFHSMGDILILTKDEEIELAKKLEEGKEVLKATVMVMPLYMKIKAGLDHREQKDSANTEKQELALRKTLEILDDLMMSRGDNKGMISGYETLQYLNGLTDGKEKVDFTTKDGQAENKHIESETGMKIDILKMNYERITKAKELVTQTKHELIIHNLRLVVYVAKYYIGRGLSLLDLIQEGNIGLIKAVDKFDYKRGFKFSTYATWWIRQAVIRALMDQVKTIRLPVNITALYGKIIKASRELLLHLGREPRIEEIANILGVPVKKVDDILGLVQDPITLQTPIGDEESTLEDVIGDNSSSPYADAERNKITEQILKVLHTLTPREEEVIRMRFGIGVDRDQTLEEVAGHLSLSRERVRQIEANAMKKLKHPKRLKTLKILDTT